MQLRPIRRVQCTNYVFFANAPFMLLILFYELVKSRSILTFVYLFIPRNLYLFEFLFILPFREC